jgi:predicted nucleotidyltransferase
MKDLRRLTAHDIVGVLMNYLLGFLIASVCDGDIFRGSNKDVICAMFVVIIIMTLCVYGMYWLKRWVYKGVC